MMEETKPQARQSTWRRVKRTSTYERVKTCAKRLAGKELWIRPEIRPRLSFYGDSSEWALCPSLVKTRPLVYSFGIGENISFDLALIRDFGAVVHAFDPTPNSATWLRDRDLPDDLQFHPWAVAASDGERKFYPRVRRDGTKSETMYALQSEDKSRPDGIVVPAKTLSSIMANLGHDTLDILKMDIEGAEYEVLDHLLDGPCRPRQLLVEFHHRFPTIGKKKTADVIVRLRAEGYRAMFVSPIGREISFLWTPGLEVRD